jgi:tRNA(fMet)-specific endonuclease VapC
MFVVDTDMLTLLQHGHERVTERFRNADEEVATSLITRIEILQGRFASILTADDREQLLRACQRLEQSEAYLRTVPILPIDLHVGVQFDRLRSNPKVRKIGRADLLIACIALAHRAILVTRNLKHFRMVPGLKIENWADS